MNGDDALPRTSSAITTSPTSGPHTIGHDDALARATFRKVTLRLIPFLCLLYIFNIIDRGNVGFARLTMQADLGMDETVFNYGAGIFYLGYLAFEVPANLLLRRIGARRWIARILISWGLVTCFTAAVTGPYTFYGARILLGVAEAGFFPGIVYYLTNWYPERERARVMAMFMAAIPFASVFGNPLSGVIMHYLDGVNGLTGWQWVFLLEGVPPVLLGFVTLFFLTDRPSEAHWLSDEQRGWLVDHLGREERARESRHGSDLLRAMADWRVWLLIAIYSTVAVGSNAAGVYFPKLIEGRFPEANKVEIGLLSALPYACAVVAMTLLGAGSDRSGERRGYLAFATLLGAFGWALAAGADSRWMFLTGLCLSISGMMSMLPLFWPLPASFLTGAAAAGGIAMINSVANIGGIFAGDLLNRYGAEKIGLYLVAGAILALTVPLARADRAPPAAG